MFLKNKKQTPSISQLDSAPITTVLGSEITFTGDIKGSQTIKIDGEVIGNIHVDNGIILGEKATVHGNLKSKNIIVFGTIHGNIDCKELILKSTGNISGDISTQTIEIDMGGKYNGQLKMNSQLSISKSPELENAKLA